MDKLTLINPSDLTIVNWTADAYDVFSERKVTAVNGNIITLDAPIMDVIDPVYATGELIKYTSNRIQKCGIENMRISSNYISETDENHGWEAVTFVNATNSWARKLEIYYFGYTGVHIYKSASWITVEDCKMIDAKSIITGGRRYSFSVDGQRSLFQNCSTSKGRHDYVNGAITCGPNVFYNSSASSQYADIGPHHRWSTGILYDNIVGNGNQNVQNRLDSGTGHGWSGGQIMFWNCTAAKIIVQDPPGDQRNWAIGCKSTTITNVGEWKTELLGTVESKGTFIVAIPSLFQAQLSERLGSLLSVHDNGSVEDPEITISPNPTKDFFKINEIPVWKSIGLIAIYNITVQLVKTFPVDQYKDSVTYNVSDLKDGVYFVHFKVDSSYKSIKLIIN